jgi:hypothetical protein
MQIQEKLLKVDCNLKGGGVFTYPLFFKFSMSKGFLIAICIIITIALILFPLIVSYKEQKNKKK